MTDDLDVASSDDRRHAVVDALDLAGFTYDELADQARTGDFKSFDARLAWVVVGGRSAPVIGRGQTEWAPDESMALLPPNRRVRKAQL